MVNESVKSTYAPRRGHGAVKVHLVTGLERQECVVMSVRATIDGVLSGQKVGDELLVAADHRGIHPPVVRLRGVVGRQIVSETNEVRPVPSVVRFFAPVILVDDGVHNPHAVLLRQREDCVEGDEHGLVVDPISRRRVPAENMRGGGANIDALHRECVGPGNFGSETLERSKRVLNLVVCHDSVPEHSLSF
jgi:hypothetical protein